MSATPTHDSTTDSPRLYLAFELGWNQWKLGFAPGLDARPWRRTIEARDLSALRAAMARARRRFELPALPPRSRFWPRCSGLCPGRGQDCIHRQPG